MKAIAKDKSRTSREEMVRGASSSRGMDPDYTVVNVDGLEFQFTR